MNAQGNGAGASAPTAAASDKGAASERSTALLSRVKEQLGAHIIRDEVSLGDAVVYAKRETIKELMDALRTKFDFNLFVNVTAVDWLDKREDRFEVVYHLLSLKTRDRLRIKVAVPEEQAEIDSVTELWPGANFMEREVFDMFGIKFRGHPDLRRILTYDEFKGHPLRKDYPVQGKQPRVPLRMPEIRNTSVDMQRPPLVKINRPRAQAK